MKRRKPVIQQQYVSTSEAAAMLGLSPQSIRRYIAAGKVRGYMVNARNIRVHVDDVRALLVPMATSADR